MKRRIIVIILGGLLLLACSGFTAAEDGEKAGLVNDGLNVTEEELQIETGSVEIIDNVIKGYYDADDSYQRSSSNADRVEDMENIVYPDYDLKYPEYFSGVYINQNHEPVFLINSENTIFASYTKLESAKKEILTLADDLTASVGVNFKTVTASLNDLLAVMRTINEFVMGEKELPVEFGATLDEFNNRVVVTFYKENENDNEEELVKLFNENVVNSPLITYDFTYEIPTEEAYTIYPGSTGLNGDAGASWNVQFSTGYKARYYDSANQVFVYGFVTAAHALSGNGADVYYGNGSQQIGEVTKYYYSGNLDFAFVEPVGGSTVSNLIGQSYMQSTGIGNFYVGSTIKKYGYYTYLTTGSVYSTSHTWSSNQTDFALASYDSQNGDSGGIVYITTNNLHYAIGVHKGRMTVDGTTYGCFCKASNISTYGLVNPAN